MIRLTLTMEQAESVFLGLFDEVSVYQDRVQSGSYSLRKMEDGRYILFVTNSLTAGVEVGSRRDLAMLLGDAVLSGQSGLD